MMLSSYPMWWLALPLLLLPVWWHRQKRQRLKAELLATARFLPSAPPEQLRVWRWRDKTLLLVRCLLLVALIAWLAATIFPWRGDTVLVDVGAEKAWAEQQISAAGFAAATRIDLPPNALQWLRANERDWRPAAKMLIVARAGQIAMPARVPQFSHQVELRTTASAAGANLAHPVATPAPAEQHRAGQRIAEQRIALATTAGRATAWQSLFAAFDVAGVGATHHQLVAEPDASTTLIVWDKPDTAPPPNWRAANWWIPTAPPTPARPATTSPAAQPATAPPVDATSPAAAVLPANATSTAAATSPTAAVLAADATSPAAATLPVTAASPTAAVLPAGATSLTAATPPVAALAMPTAVQSAFPQLGRMSTLTVNGITLSYADSARGRLWTSSAFPPADATTARALYESWQQLSAAPSPAYATPSQTFSAARSALPAITDAKPAQWLALALLALFIIERILTHARRN